jgi:hypothetical protein
MLAAHPIIVASHCSASKCRLAHCAAEPLEPQRSSEPEFSASLTGTALVLITTRHHTWAGSCQVFSVLSNPGSAQIWA